MSFHHGDRVYVHETPQIVHMGTVVTSSSARECDAIHEVVRVDGDDYCRIMRCNSLYPIPMAVLRFLSSARKWPGGTDDFADRFNRMTTEQIAAAFDPCSEVE